MRRGALGDKTRQYEGGMPATYRESKHLHRCGWQIMPLFYLLCVVQLYYECILYSHHFAKIRLKIGQYTAEIFQNRERNYQHVGQCIAGHRTRFCYIARALERPIAGVQNRSVWLGLIPLLNLPISFLPCLKIACNVLR